VRVIGVWDGAGGSARGEGEGGDVDELGREDEGVSVVKLEKQERPNRLNLAYASDRRDAGKCSPGR
jgi:hypothetical protein